MWYTASFTGKHDGEEIFPDCIYFEAENDEIAIQVAKEAAEQGVDYDEVGHIDLELCSVVKVDADNEFEELETIWY